MTESANEAVLLSKLWFHPTLPPLSPLPRGMASGKVGVEQLEEWVEPELGLSLLRREEGVATQTLALQLRLQELTDLLGQPLHLRLQLLLQTDLELEGGGEGERGGERHPPALQRTPTGPSQPPPALQRPLVGPSSHPRAIQPDPLGPPATPGPMWLPPPALQRPPRPLAATHSPPPPRGDPADLQQGQHLHLWDPPMTTAGS
ncbi:LOW QUALITY PROTEIN: hypothetical protein CRUP_021926, partial [Coryphaenoides rupestris]